MPMAASPPFMATLPPPLTEEELFREAEAVREEEAAGPPEDWDDGPEPPPPDFDDDEQQRGGGATDGCEACGGHFDLRFQSVFNLRVCYACTRNNKRYALLSATDAKARFALTDNDMRPLPRLVKNSTTYRASGGTVNLFCTSQVMAVALAKHGSAEAIEHAVQSRVEASIARKTKKRKANSAQAGDFPAAAPVASTRGGAVQGPRVARGAVRAASEQTHAHVYSRRPVLDSASGSHMRTCDTCGATEAVEIM
jgi:hypothetical protein